MAPNELAQPTQPISLTAYAHPDRSPPDRDHRLCSPFSNGRPCASRCRLILCKDLSRRPTLPCFLTIAISQCRSLCSSLPPHPRRRRVARWLQAFDLRSVLSMSVPLSSPDGAPPQYISCPEATCHRPFLLHRGGLIANSLHRPPSGPVATTARSIMRHVALRPPNRHR
jgi:hypothetical protein